MKFYFIRTGAFILKEALIKTVKEHFKLDNTKKMDKQEALKLLNLNSTYNNKSLELRYKEINIEKKSEIYSPYIQRILESAYQFLKN